MPLTESEVANILSAAEKQGIRILFEPLCKSHEELRKQVAELRRHIKCWIRPAVLRELANDSFDGMADVSGKAKEFLTLLGEPLEEPLA